MMRPSLDPERRKLSMRFPQLRRLRLFLASLLGVAVLCLGGGMLGLWGLYLKISADLPSIDSLRVYRPPTVSRIYTSDDRLMAELASERRIFVPITAIPPRVKNAFIAAEDQNFYLHGGIDYAAILRAGVTDLIARHGKRPLGASTITQQVAKVMLLNSNVLTLTRKIREAMLAVRIEQNLSKDKILEIYLNGIYLGNGTYGVVAAAQSYFNKTLDQLDNAEAATLAALPKSPTNYNPFLHPRTALWRRNWVLDRMAETGAITREDARAAQKQELLTETRVRFGPLPDSEWFGEEVRRQLIARYGEERALQGGLDVHTSLDQPLQSAATRFLHEGLIRYDRSHSGWRGPVRRLSLAGTDWKAALSSAAAPAGMLRSWRLGIVLPGAPVRAGWLENGTERSAPLRAADLGWARRTHPLRPGDVIMIEPQADKEASLQQIPLVEGAAVTIDVHTGRVLSLVGGWSFRESQFNRATQALRQPGSSFKPLVYLAAMERNISPSEKFDDSPISFGDWHPQNYEHNNWGPTTLHDALRESRNLVTIRVAAHLGMKAVADTAIRAGMVEQMPHVLPAALGAVETTVLKEAAAYAAIANGGHVVTPNLVDYIQDPDGTVLWQAPNLTLNVARQPATAVSLPGSDQGVRQANGLGSGQGALTASPLLPAAEGIEVPHLEDRRPILASPESAFQIVTMMRDVIAHGTGRLAGVGIDRPIAGKTGTSQDYHDAWFAGFSPDIATVVWIGFDTPRSLGRNETGGRVAGPIWNQIMKAAMAHRPKLDFRAPDGVTLAQYATGRIPAVDAFKPGQIPGETVPLHGFGAGTRPLTAADTGADVIPGSESDMPAPTAEEPRGDVPLLPPSATPAPKNKQAPATTEGDIGVGGLY